MELLEAIEKRYSYRGKFTDRKVSRDELKMIVEAGLKAPSGKNCQTTRFVIIDDEDIKDKIQAMENASPAIKSASAYIACIVNKEPEKVYEGCSFEVEDCAAAVENMLLVITSLGLESVWVDGWLRLNERAHNIGKLINLPESMVIRVILPIGKAEKEGHGPKKMSFEQRAAFNSYDL